MFFSLVLKEAQKATQFLKSQLIPALKERKLSFVSDLWHRKTGIPTDYLDLTAFWINSEMKLKHQVVSLTDKASIQQLLIDFDPTFSKNSGAMRPI